MFVVDGGELLLSKGLLDAADIGKLACPRWDCPFRVPETRTTCPSLRAFQSEGWNLAGSMRSKTSFKR